MFDYLKGSLAYKNANSSATIEVGGIGWLVNLTQKDYNSLGDINSQVKVFTVLIHKEDSMTLFGFLKKEAADIFKILITVSGVGPKTVMLLLDEFEPFDIISLVINGDYKELTRTKGIGAKVAQKIILELKDKLTSYQGGNTPIRQGSCTSCANTQNTEDAQMVLLSLGYTKEEVAGAIGQVLTKLPPNASAEEILKDSLKILSI